MNGAAPNARTLSLIAVAVVASLGGAYLLGWTLGTPRPHREPAALTNTATGTSRPDAATHPDSDRIPGPTPPGAAPEDPHSQAERPPPPAEPGDGPYGSRRTTGTAEVALTFDDGPDPNYTPQTLALLRAYQIQATFCLVGANASRYPYLVRAIVADGHTLCNHSWSHDLALGGRPRSTIQDDLNRTNEALRAAAPGVRIGYFRQPGGNWTAGVVAVARELGMAPLHWAVDPQDWRRPGASSITTAVTGATFAGAIVLLHDAGGNRQDTVSALRSILPNLTRRFLLRPLPTGHSTGSTGGRGGGSGGAV
jgi:peptidoglycan/xylan/chitin deacetylase (PgdA/CDA1 family)